MHLCGITAEDRPGSPKLLAGETLAVQPSIPVSLCVELAKGFEPPTL
jgi:hypothetical protein